MGLNTDEKLFNYEERQQNQRKYRHYDPVNDPRRYSLFQVVAQIKAQRYRPCRKHLMVFDHFILLPCDGAYHDRFYAKVEQVRDFVCYGLACRTPIHIEAVRKHQPDLLTAVVHVCTLSVLGREITTCKNSIEFIESIQISVTLFYR